MNSPVQIVVTPQGERLAVLPEQDYLLLLAASEDQDGEVRPGFLEELRKRRRMIAEGGEVVSRGAGRGK